jgi:hypothetical protein
MSEEVKDPQTEQNNEPARQGSEGADEGTKKDDIEAALSEYDEGTGGGSSAGQQQTQKPAEKPSDEALERIKRLEQQEYERVYRADLGKAINHIRGDFAADEVDDEFIETWLNARAKKDPRVANAWRLRDEDTAKFGRVLNALKQEFAEKHQRLRKADTEATETREVVSEAVRRGSGKAPEGKAPDYSKMSDVEFREAVRKEHGFSPL